MLLTLSVVTISSLIASWCFTFAVDNIFLFVKSRCALVSGNTNKVYDPRKEWPTDRSTKRVNSRSLTKLKLNSKYLLTHVKYLLIHVNSVFEMYLGSTCFGQLKTFLWLLGCANLFTQIGNQILLAMFWGFLRRLQVTYWQEAFFFPSKSIHVAVLSMLKLKSMFMYVLCPFLLQNES